MPRLSRIRNNFMWHTRSKALYASRNTTYTLLPLPTKWFAVSNSILVLRVVELFSLKPNCKSLDIRDCFYFLTIIKSNIFPMRLLKARARYLSDNLVMACDLGIGVMLPSSKPSAVVPWITILLNNIARSTCSVWGTWIMHSDIIFTVPYPFSCLCFS